MSKELNIHPVIARLLADRGIAGVDEARSFLFPSTDNLCPLSRYKGLKEVAGRLRRAIDNNERIVIYGDYDCDGICATAMLYIFLTDMGVDCAYYIPDRHTEGYGINIDALEAIAERYYPDLIISVDCGITSAEEVAYAMDELGIDMIITDHHEPSDTLPDCPVFNPKLEDGAYADLCGAGVALRLIEAMSDIAVSKRYYDIAALATVADVVPLTGDNRIIVYFGLKMLNLRRRRGIKLLADSCVKGDITSYDIAFKLAPRINSTGRIETAAETVSLFYETDTFMLESLVDKINKLNEIRRTLTDDLSEACIELLRRMDMEERKIIVLYNPYWDEGVLGITASRLTELYNRPVLLMTDSGGAVKGSGRSVKGVDIHRCIKGCSNYLIKYGGHKMACGFTIDKQLINQFDFVINSYCANKYPDFIPRPKQGEDAIPFPIDADIKFARQLEMLQPYGEGNPKPAFYTERGRCLFAEIGDKGHLKERDGDKEWLHFNAADNCDWYNGGSRKRFDFRADYRTYGSDEYVSLSITSSLPVEAPADTLMLSRYYACSAGGEISSIFNPERIASAQLTKLLGGKRTGTCAIAFSNAGIEKVKSILGGDCSVVYGRPHTPCPYNTLIYGLSRDADLSAFDNIVLAEEPLLEGAIDNLIIDKDCKVYILSDGAAVAWADGVPDKAEMGEIYKAVRRALSYKPLRSEYSIYKAAGKMGSYGRFLLALFVFVDLGLVSTDTSGYKIESGVKRSLDESKLYCKAKEACNG